MTDLSARDRRFWLQVAYAVPIGLMAGGAGLSFTYAVGKATKWLWPAEIDNIFFGGELWWIAVTVAGGVIVASLGLRGVSLVCQRLGVIQVDELAPG